MMVRIRFFEMPSPLRIFYFPLPCAVLRTVSLCNRSSPMILIGLLFLPRFILGAAVFCGRLVAALGWKARGGGDVQGVLLVLILFTGGLLATGALRE